MICREFYLIPTPKDNELSFVNVQFQFICSKPFRNVVKIRRECVEGILEMIKYFELVNTAVSSAYCETLALSRQLWKSLL